jgi:hypothetical protein
MALRHTTSVLPCSASLTREDLYLVFFPVRPHLLEKICIWLECNVQNFEDGFMYNSLYIYTTAHNSLLFSFLELLYLFFLLLLLSWLSLMYILYILGLFPAAFSIKD